MTPRATARKTLLTAAYCLALALLVEGASRALVASDWFSRRMIRQEDELAWRIRWVRHDGRERRMSYGFDVYHPTRGWALRPGIHDMAAFGDKILNSSSRGLRGREERGYEKPEGRIRILVFGDSFTFGEEVDDAETYCHDLEEMLPGVEVLNFGVHGYGHDQMLLYLEEEGVKYHPDVVLLGFISDDMLRNVLGFRDFAKPRFELRAEKLVLGNVPVPTPEEAAEAELYRSRFADLLGFLWRARERRSGLAEERMKELTLAILDQMAVTIRRVGATPAFAYLPVYGEITKPDMAMTHRERFFFEYCRRRGIQSMYLRRFFIEKMEQGTKFKASGHWGPLEHRTVAEGIRAYIVEKGVIPYPPRSTVGRDRLSAP